MICPPALRPAVVVLLAMLAAKGTSVLRNVYVIDRGYEELAERLNQLGARSRPSATCRPRLGGPRPGPAQLQPSYLVISIETLLMS